jgi:hypothetical protein
VDFADNSVLDGLGARWPDIGGYLDLIDALSQPAYESCACYCQRSPSLHNRMIRFVSLPFGTDLLMSLMMSLIC